MKSFIPGTFILILLITSLEVSAQTNKYTGNPLSSSGTENYGTDIFIQGNLSEDQRGAKIAVSSTGILYSAYIISNGGYRIARSNDNGLTWSHSATLRPGYYITALDIAVTGSDTSSLTIWVISSAYAKASIDMFDVTVFKYNQHMVSQGSQPVDNMISNYGYPDVAIATDFDFPSTGASPFSIGLVYSKINAVNDEVIFKSSADGGASFSNTQVLASSGHYYVNVALAFGRSASFPQGRYFAAWDKSTSFSYYGSYFGKIFTSYSQTQFNSSWSAPLEIDQIGGGLTNGAKDPSIACMADQVDNGSGEFSVVIAFNRMLTASGSQTSVFGVANLSPVTGNTWTAAFSSGTANIRDIEPDLAYDLSHQKFYITWSDSLNARLKCSVNDMDLTAGGSWNSFSNGYNDGTNIDNPFPRVKVNPVSQQVVHVWESNRNSTTANATFDGNSLPVGLTEQGISNGFQVSVYPNPCRAEAIITLTLVNETTVTVKLFDLTGRCINSIPSGVLHSGNNSLKLNTGYLESGCYLLNVTAGKTSSTKRLVVVH